MRRKEKLEERGIIEKDSFPFNREIAKYIVKKLNEEELISCYCKFGFVDHDIVLKLIYNKYKELFKEAVEYYTKYEYVEVLKKGVTKLPSGRFIKEDETGASLIKPTEAYETKKRVRSRPNVRAMTTKDKLKVVEYYLGMDTSLSTYALVSLYIPHPF